MNGFPNLRLPRSEYEYTCLMLESGNLYCKIRDAFNSGDSSYYDLNQTVSDWIYQNWSWLACTEMTVYLFGQHSTVVRFSSGERWRMPDSQYPDFRRKAKETCYLK